MAVLQDININVHGQPSEKRLQTFLRLSQNENGRMINFRVLGAPLPSNCTATFSGTKPDGNVYSKAGTVTGNFVIIEEDIQMTAVAGVWDAKLDIINGTHNIMTALIRVVVDADVVDPDAIASDSQLHGLVAEAKYYAEHARTDAYGSPLTAPTKAQMTDHTRVYVYTGSEPNMVAGNWYLWNGSAWVSGGVYNAVAVQTDTTLSVAGKAADGKVTGDTIEELKEDLSVPSKNLFGFVTSTPVSANVSGVTVTYYESTVKFNGTATASGQAKWSFNALAHALGVQVGDQLTLSYEKVGGSYSNGNPYLTLSNVADTSIRLDQRTQRSFAYTAAMSNLQIYFANGMVFDNYEINLQIERGNEATPFTKYGGLIANDKTARFYISKIENRMDTAELGIEESKETQLIIGKFEEFEQGTLNSSGLPSSATYRLRSVRHIPFSVFDKVTFVTSGYGLTVYCYAEDFTFLGYTTAFTSGYVDKNAVKEQYPSTYYVKFLFYNSAVTTIEVNDLETAEFKFYTLLAQNNLYDTQVKDGFPYGWDIPYRSIMQMMGAGFSFAIQTDTHYFNGTPKVNYNGLKNLSKQIGFDFIAHLGDIIRGYEYDTVSASYEVYKEAISGLVDGAGCHVFALIGNHDNGCMYATATGDIDDAFLPDELFSLIERPTTTLDSKVAWGSRTGLYFYRDFDDVRVIVLNTSDLPYEEVSASDINVNNLAISTAQVNWFSNVALDTDKAVLVLSHAPLDGTNTITNRTAIVSAMESFAEGGGTIIANVAGHTHTINATKTNGINYIVCDNGSDRCEIFAVDLENRTIATQQIGEDFTGSRSFTF